MHGLKVFRSWTLDIYLSTRCTTAAFRTSVVVAAHRFPFPSVHIHNTHPGDEQTTVWPRAGRRRIAKLAASKG